MLRHDQVCVPVINGNAFHSEDSKQQNDKKDYQIRKISVLPLAVNAELFHLASLLSSGNTLFALLAGLYFLFVFFLFVEILKLGFPVQIHLCLGFLISELNEFRVPLLMLNMQRCNVLRGSYVRYFYLLRYFHMTRCFHVSGSFNMARRLNVLRSLYMPRHIIVLRNYDLLRHL